MKKNAQEKQPRSITDMNEMLTDLWAHMSVDYFINLAESMQNVLKQRATWLYIDFIFNME